MSVFKRLKLLRERGSHWFESWSLQYPITAGVVSASTSFAMMTVDSVFNEALLSFGNVLAHEMGHAILGLYRGRRPLRMIFRSQGGYVSFDVRQKPLTVDDIPIFLGGPYAQSLYWVFVGLFLGKTIAWKKVFVKSTFIGDAIDMSGSDQQRTFKFIRELSSPNEGDRVLELEIISQCCRLALKLLGIYAAKAEYRSWGERLSINRARIDVVSTIVEVMMKLVRLLTRYRLRTELLQHFANKFGTKPSMVDLRACIARLKQRFDDGERIALELELLNIPLAEYRQRFPECAVSGSWESLNVDVRRDTDRIVSRCLFSRFRSFFDDDDSESICGRVRGFVGRVINIDPVMSASECSFENIHRDKTQPTLFEFLEPISPDPERRRRQNQYAAALLGEYLLRFVILLNVVGTHRV